MDTPGIYSTSISMSLVSIFASITTISTFFSISSKQAISAKTVETKPQLSTIFLDKGKEKKDDIDLDEEIMIPNWNISNLNFD